MANQYGDLDASYQAAGELEGITKLVECFYNYMEQLSEANNIREMHPKDLTITKDKLVCFLSGWLGGPRLFRDKYGRISLPMAHKHLAISIEDRDSWLLCMSKAADDQPYDESFKKYLLQQLAFPANRIYQVAKQ
ncbi:MAG: group II truncated hemoglobin [Enterobacterales bacterium]|nr:group II truncated hemoglobin [Enterobacterales bacterium]